MLEAVVNVSEGRRSDVVAEVAAAGGRFVLDVHTDADHNRSVITVAGSEDAAFAVVAGAVSLIDVSTHVGVHPRLGAADVVPFVPLGGSTMDDAVGARDRCAARIARELGVPCFLYGPSGRSLPDVRRMAFSSLMPEYGPVEPHATAGASCVGARDVLVAYNVWLRDGVSLEEARRVAASLRSPALRTLALVVAGGAAVQVSCNLVDPMSVGPALVYDLVAAQLPVVRAELVGLVPRAVLDAVPVDRWDELDLSVDATIEARLVKAGLDGGSS